MSHIPQTLDALSRLLTYPNEQTLEAAELLYVAVADELPEAAAEASAFGKFVDAHEPWEVEEAFTRTFDVNPACALEIGWHLFGEEYARGTMLVRMREELRKYGIPESSELTDHITHVLAVVAAMPADEAERFVGACVAPAVEKMRLALEGNETPYRHAINCLSAYICHTWDEVIMTGDDATGAEQEVSRAAGADPLNSYPVRGLSDQLTGLPTTGLPMVGGQPQSGGCGSMDGGPIELVTLQMKYSAPESSNQFEQRDDLPNPASPTRESQS
jgi:nitrate reductase molybdenum cofactor assembly chaperone